MLQVSVRFRQLCIHSRRGLVVAFGGIKSVGVQDMHALHVRHRDNWVALLLPFYFWRLVQSTPCDTAGNSTATMEPGSQR